MLCLCVITSKNGVSTSRHVGTFCHVLQRALKAVIYLQIPLIVLFVCPMDYSIMLPMLEHSYCKKSCKTVETPKPEDQKIQSSKKGAMTYRQTTKNISVGCQSLEGILIAEEKYQTPVIRMVNGEWR